MVDKVGLFSKIIELLELTMPHRHLQVSAEFSLYSRNHAQFWWWNMQSNCF